MGEPVRISARGDGFALGGELFVPAGPPRAAVLIAGAMAVRASYYAPFAAYIAEQGAAALVVDYRGIGTSRPPGPLRDFHATFHDWGVADLAGAAEFLVRRFPGVPLLWVGHSAGAQLMGLAHPAPIHAALFIAAGTAWWKGYRGLARAFMLSLWYLIFPVLLAFSGHLPMRRFRQGDDVPRGVAREWAQWGRDRRYVFSYAESRGGMGYTAYAGPLLALSIPDDRYAPAGSTAHLLSLYPRARKEQRTLSAGRPVGHFGFFRQRDLWPMPVRWLLDHG
jgi:predicted alpha/beta hydrolase